MEPNASDTMRIDAGTAMRLMTLLDVEGRVLRAADLAEIGFVAVNDALPLAPYRQAVLWSAAKGVEAVSGLAMPDRNAPFLIWTEAVCRHLAPRAEPVELTSADLPEALAGQWAEWLPLYALWVPLRDGAGLLYAAEQPWDPGAVALLARLAEAVGAARGRFVRPSAWSTTLAGLRRGRRRWFLVGAAVLGALFPVTGSVLSPADLVPAHPVVVRSPLEGVVDRIHVKPNQPVTEGMPLFDLDATQLTGQLEVARQQYATAEAEYRQAAQAQVFDPKAKAQAAILAGKADEKAAEVTWLESRLERIRVKAPSAGIAVLDDPSEWIGRPAAVGEKVMMVADETDTEVEAWVAPADVGEVRPGARLTLFLNTRPLSPLRAVVRSVAYEPSARPDVTLAHRVRAALADDEDKPRLGLKGTARIDGETVPLVWWLFRKPLATIRQFIGF